MFKSQTVLVVGAGASCEAGLPSGDGIKSKIAELLDIRFPDGHDQSTGDYRITEALRTASRAAGERSINPFLQKAWQIRDIVPSALSIDNFLDAHRGDHMMELCGKLGIIRSILDAEQHSTLWARPQDGGSFNLNNLAGSWYIGFLNMLVEGVPRQEADKVFDNISIVTFNYDRCIEHFIVQALADYYGLEAAHAQSIAAKLPIYHPYGKVGDLQWQAAATHVPFGSDRCNLLDVVPQIKTFTEGMDDDEMRSKINDAMIEAETLIFLGFAFHPINMELLTPGVETCTRRVFSTTLGLSDADESVIEDDIIRMIGKHKYSWEDQQEIRRHLAKLKCGDFFKQYFRSMSAPAS